MKSGYNVQFLVETYQLISFEQICPYNFGHIFSKSSSKAAQTLSGEYVPKIVNIYFLSYKVTSSPFTMGRSWGKFACNQLANLSVTLSVPETRRGHPPPTRENLFVEEPNNQFAYTKQAIAFVQFHYESSITSPFHPHCEILVRCAADCDLLESQRPFPRYHILLRKHVPVIKQY